MTGEHLKTMRLAALFLLGLLLFNYPILLLVNRWKVVWGMPLLFFYLFGVWFLLIVLTALITGAFAKRRQSPPPE